MFTASFRGRSEYGSIDASRLVKYALAKDHPEDPHFRWTPEFKTSYGVGIIGAGGNWLATAYYLATRHHRHRSFR